MEKTNTCPACDRPADVAERACCGSTACEPCAADGYCCELAEAAAYTRAAAARRERGRRMAAIRREVWLQSVAADALWRTRLAVAYAEVSTGARPPAYADVNKLRAAVLS